MDINELMSKLNANPDPAMRDRYLSPLMQRVASRQYMLEDDIKELAEYMKTEAFSDLQPLAQQLIHVQLQTMTVLVGTLKHRLQLATGT